jgi:four helix bundle protein
MTLSQTLTLDLVRQLRPVVATLKLASPPLADQLVRAATSAALNTAEAHAREGRDKLRVLRIAFAEAKEVQAALEVAAGLALLDEPALDAPRTLADRTCAVLFGLARKVAQG